MGQSGMGGTAVLSARAPHTARRAESRAEAVRKALRRPGGRAGAALAPAWALALALLALGSLSGCGGSSDNGLGGKSGSEVLAAAKQAAAQAESVHVLANSSIEGTSSVVDLHLSTQGGWGKVSLLGSVFEVVYLNGEIYLKGNQLFYHRLEAIRGISIKLLPGTWLKGSAEKGPLAQFTAFVDLPGELTRILSSSGSLSAPTATSFQGKRALAVEEAAKLYKGTLYVSATGKPYPLALVKTKGKGKHEREGGRTSFSQWDRPVRIAAPSPWVDVAALKG
jgi:hypothetical protein